MQHEAQHHGEAGVLHGAGDGALVLEAARAGDAVVEHSVRGLEADLDVVESGGAQRLDAPGVETQS